MQKKCKYFKFTNCLKCGIIVTTWGRLVSTEIIIFKGQVVRYTIHSNLKITGNRNQLAFA